MANATIALAIPDDVRDSFSSEDEARAFAFRSFVIELLRSGRIGQGRAAELLGISRWEILDLMAAHHVPSGPQTEEDATAEVAAARRAFKESRRRVSR